MDINRDEVRRQLREAEKEQQASMPQFRSMLHRVFHSSDIPTAAKAELLGAPGRRQFLRIGGATVLGAAVLAACGSDDDKSSAGSTTATTVAGSSTTSPEMDDAKAMDLTLARTAASLENLAVAVYSVALGEGGDTKLPTEVKFDPAVVDAAKLFRTHHQAHADALNGVLKSAGAKPYTDPNKVLLESVVVKKLPSLTSQQAVVMFAKELENLAAGTYAYAASVLSTPQLRQTIMSIGGVESRHATALALVLDPSGATAVPRAFTDAGPEGRVPDSALVSS